MMVFVWIIGLFHPGMQNLPLNFAEMCYSIIVSNPRRISPWKCAQALADNRGVCAKVSGD